MSDLDQGGRRQAFGRVYDDACDEGLTLISQWTGERMVFVIDHHEYMGEGEDKELAAWVLVPVTPKYRAKGLKIKVFND